MISFTPILDRVVVRRCDSGLSKKVSKAGLILPETVKESYKASQGELISCGEDCPEIIQNLVGKEILFNRFSGDEIVLNGEEFLMLSYADILGGISNDTISE